MLNGADPRAAQWRKMMRSRIERMKAEIATARPEDRAELEFELSKDLAELATGWSPRWNGEDFPG